MTAAASAAVLLIAGTLYDTQPVAFSLAAGSTVEATSKAWTATADFTEVIVLANSRYTVAESKEKNNTTSGQVCPEKKTQAQWQPPTRLDT